MKAERLPYATTGYFTKLLADYIDNQTKLKDFYSFDFSADGVANAIAYRDIKPVDRQTLVNELTSQYNQSNTPVSLATQQNIDALLNPETYTVTTGHQLCLFTGPLYVIYKLIGTIALCNQLKQQYPTKHFVPVYWMHTEDADIEEINNVSVFKNKLVWNDAGTGFAGGLTTQTLAPLIAELKPILGDSANAQQLLNLIEESYLGQANLADATRHFVNGLLGHKGLVILDPNNAQLKKAFSPVLVDELTNHKAEALVNQTTAQLTSLGYDAQVTPRQINLFYLTEDKQRLRLVKTENGFATADNKYTFTPAEMLAIAQNSPELLSPNVVLRPLYQEVILPNIVYLGGGGELAYWLQYKALFNAYGYELPVLVLRNSFLLIDESQRAKMTKFGVTNATLFNSPDKLVKDYLSNNSAYDTDIVTQRQLLLNLITELEAKALAIDQSLKGFIEGEGKKLNNSLDTIEQKLLKAIKLKEDTQVQGIKNLKESLFPEGELQERYNSFLARYVNHGPAFFDEIENLTNPFGKEFTVLG